MRLFTKIVIVLFAFSCLAARVRADADSSANTGDRISALRGCLGTYASPPRKADGHVDFDALLIQLKDLHANTYSWLVWKNASDWDDLHTFLPMAAKENIKVWVTLVPPSESPPKTHAYSEPFRMDYTKWATEIAKLAVDQPNLVAWSIDDFNANLKVFTPEKVNEMVAAARGIDPKLAFIPCVYYKGATAKFAADYGKYLDGILFPYRDESAKPNLTDPSAVAAEIKHIHQILGPGKVVVLDVYSLAHSKLGDSTPDYVRQVLVGAKPVAEGEMIYCHPPVGSEKYKIVREVYGGEVAPTAK